jgi:hypothetical protein
MLTSIAFCIERYLPLLSIKAFNLHQLLNHASLGTILLREYQLLNRSSLIKPVVFMVWEYDEKGCSSSRSFALAVLCACRAV